MSDRYVLEAGVRETFGKKVKNLRAEGRIPGVIYGKTQDPVHVTIDWSNLRLALVEVGGSGLVDIELGDETYTTLIREVDRHPIRQDVLHVDFYAVNLKEKLVSHVPVVMKGVEDAVARVGGRVILETLTLTVESLPTDIPGNIVVSVESLEEIGDAILVKDLPDIEGAEYLDDPEMSVVRTDYFREIIEPEEEEEEESLLDELVTEPELVGEEEEEELPEEEE